MDPYHDKNGKRHREKAGSLSAAKKLVDLRRGEKLQGKLPELRKHSVLFRELTDAALKYSEPGEKGTNHSRMKVLVEKFGDSPAEEIRPAEIKDWLAEHEEWTLATKNRYTALLKLVYRLAEERQLIKYNPARLVRQPKENNARIRFLTDEEEKKLRDAIPSEHMAEFVIGLETGMRRKEQYEATWDKVNFLTGTLTVPRSKHGETRHVKLNSRSLAAFMSLKTEKSRGRIHDFMSPRSWFDPAVEQAGLKDFSWHCLRHTFISRLVMNGVDLRTVMELAGHKNISMTMRYAHLAPSHLEAAVEKTGAPTATPTATEPKSSQHKQQVSIQ